MLFANDALSKALEPLPAHLLLFRQMRSSSPVQEGKESPAKFISYFFGTYQFVNELIQGESHANKKHSKD